MVNAGCTHQWRMVDIEYGFIVTERCFECKKIVTYFSHNEKPPLEEFREGGHFWNVMESAQSMRFNLKCSRCGAVVNFSDLMGLMMCTGCLDECEVQKMMKRLEPQKQWVYVAFSFLPVEEHPPLPEEKLKTLEDYFNTRRKSSESGSSIRIVSSRMIEDYSVCFAEVIRDLDLLSLQKTPE